MRYYKVSEAAEIVRVDDGKILNEIHTGRLKAVNVAANPNGIKPRWRISEKDLNDWLEFRSNQPKPEAPKRRRRAATTSGRQWF